MASFLTHIALGSVLGAAGAVLGGLVLVALRTLLSKRRRQRVSEKIRQIGVIAATKQALFDESDPELDFPKHRATS
jgi:hypothetical protein